MFTLSQETTLFVNAFQKFIYFYFVLKKCFDTVKVILSVLYFGLFVHIFLLKKEEKRRKEKSATKPFGKAKPKKILRYSVAKKWPKKVRYNLQTSIAWYCK